MIYYGQPGPYDEEVEERIFSTIRQVMKRVGRSLARDMSRLKALVCGSRTRKRSIRLTAVCLLILMANSTPGQVQTIWAADPLSPPCTPLEIDTDRQELLNQDGPWRAFRGKNGLHWTVLWNEHNSTPNLAHGEGARLASGPLTAEQVIELSFQFVDDNYSLFRLGSAQLIVERLDRADALTGDAIWYVTLRQVHEGVPVFDSRIDLTITDAGILMVFGSHWLFPEIGIGVKPALTPEQAQGLVLKQIKFNPDVDQISGELEIYPCSGKAIEPRLAWKVLASTAEPLKNWVFHIDAQTGDVLHYWDGVLYADVFGSVTGRGRVFNPTGAVAALPMGNMAVFGSGGVFGFASPSGFYNIFVGPNPATMSANLGAGGIFARVDNIAGAEIGAAVTAPQPGPINLPINPVGVAEFDIAQVNGYFHTNFVHGYVQTRLIPREPRADMQALVNVNINDLCNGYYTGFTINFFRAGGGCVNSAFDTFIYHEWGHLLDDAIGGLTNGALSEGIGDMLASFASTNLIGADQPLVFEGFTGPFTFVRINENNRQWPAPECGGEVHCVGEVYGGFTWDAHRNIRARGAHVRVAEDLLLNSLRANSANIPTQVLQTFVTDVARYGGSLTTGSPNYYSLCEAAVDKGFNSTAPAVIPVLADFGSAPFQSTLAVNGPRHRVICGEWLGQTAEPLPSVDGETDTRGGAEILNDGWTNYNGVLNRGVSNTVNIPGQHLWPPRPPIQSGRRRPKAVSGSVGRLERQQQLRGPRGEGDRRDHRPHHVPGRAEAADVFVWRDAASRQRQYPVDSHAAVLRRDHDSARFH